MIKGKTIESARTLKSMYDQDSIEVTVGKKYYRIKAEELLKIIKKFDFEEKTPRKHTYLQALKVGLSAIN